MKQKIVHVSIIEKIFILIFPILLGALGWFVIPNILPLLLKIPFISNWMLLQFLQDIDSSWIPLVLGSIGIIAGVILSFLTYIDALKVYTTNSYLYAEKGETKKRIPIENIKIAFMEEKQLVIISQDTREWIRAKTDVPAHEVAYSFKEHEIPWTESDPFEPDFHLWQLNDEHYSDEINKILYKRRLALREGEEEEAVHLLNDLSELGIVVKNAGEEQFVRTI